MVGSIILISCLSLTYPGSGEATSNPHFKVAADDWSPFFIVNTSSVSRPYSGVMFELLKYVQKSLNFTFEIRRPLDGQWGYVLENGSVTGMVGMVNRSEVDFALGEYQ